MRPEVERETEIFERALELSRTERHGYLEEACRDAPVMRERLGRLVEIHEETSAETTFSTEWVESFDDDNSEDPLVGQTIGGFHIVSVLGEGGMGVVYEAEQVRPERKVALKVVRPFMATPEMMARFEREAQMLGRLQHPGIAQIYEVGSLPSTSGVRPYFAMEFVRGKTLKAHVQENDCTTSEKLELLAKVADAVDHAHRRNVIHRDLKPQNVIVDESGQPKVLDFGIARVTDHHDLQQTLQTKTGQIIGTLPYMSPEQIRDKSTDLDARTDVWALGVIGYQLLTGELPLAVGDKGVAEAARMILDEDPSSLSSYSRTFRGDIETIIAKALEKDRDRRYASAAEMASDIRAYLLHQPITARPASTWYQLMKFAGRNVGLVAGVILAFLSLTVGLVLALRSAREAEDARTETLAALASEQKAKEQTLSALRDAEEQATIARETVSFLTKDLLSNADPYTTAGRKMTLEGAVDRATEAIETRLDGQPIVEAAVRQALGFVYFGIGQPIEAEMHLERALELVPDGDVLMPHSTALVKLKLAIALNEQGKSRECIDLLEPLMPDLLAQGASEGDVGLAHMALGHAYEGDARFVEARAAFSKGREIYEELYGPDSMPVLNAREYVLGLDLRLGTAIDALEETREVYTKRALLQGLMHPMVLRSRSNLGRALIRKGHFQEALELGKELESQVIQVHGEDHLLLGNVYRQRSDVYSNQGRFEDAVSVLGRSVDVFRKAGQLEFLSNSLSRLSYLNRRLGRLEEARVQAEEAHEFSLEHFGARHLTTIGRAADLAVLTTDLERRHALLSENEAIARELAPESTTAMRLCNDLAMSYSRRGDYDEALRCMTMVVESMEDHYGGEHPATARTIENRANVLRSLERFDESKAGLERALAIRKKVLPEGHPDIGRSLFNLGSLELNLENLERANDLLGQAVELTRKAFGDLHSDVAFMARVACKALHRAEDFRALIPMARTALAAAKAGGKKKDMATASRYLGIGLMGIGEHEDAEELLIDQWEMLREVAPDEPDLGHAAFELGRCLAALEEHEEAIARLLEAEKIYAAWNEAPDDLMSKVWKKLVEVYEDSGDDAAAATWRKKVE